LKRSAGVASTRECFYPAALPEDDEQHYCSRDNPDGRGDQYDVALAQKANGSGRARRLLVAFCLRGRLRETVGRRIARDTLPRQDIRVAAAVHGGGGQLKLLFNRRAFRGRRGHAIVGHRDSHDLPARRTSTLPAGMSGGDTNCMSTMWTLKPNHSCLPLVRFVGLCPISDGWHAVANT